MNGENLDDIDEYEPEESGDGLQSWQRDPASTAAAAKALRELAGEQPWKPGDSCGSCGSTDTSTEDGVACCRKCGRSDADE